MTSYFYSIKNVILGSIFLILISFSVKGQVDDRNASARYIAPGDPNLDPNWDWTVCCTGHTMYYSKNGATPLRLNNVQLPFYTNGNPLADQIDNNKRDMWPQDGWVLAYRDFGTAQYAPSLPFFILYNKYTGILRVMIYNATSELISAYKMELRFGNTSPKSPLFTFTDDQRPFRDDFDGSKVLSYIGKTHSLQDWYYADFTLFGYEPNLDINSKLHLELYTIDESQMNVDSKVFTLNGMIGGQANPTGTGSSTTVGVLNKGEKLFKGANEVRNAAKEVVPKLSSSSPFKQPLNNLVNSTVGNIVPFVGPLLGLITTFIGGGGSTTPAPQTVNLQGSLQLTGQIVNTKQLCAYDFALSINAPKLANGTLDPAFYYPLKSIPWGIFNVNSIIRNYTTEEQCGYVEDPYSGELRWECSTATYFTGYNHIPYILNPNSGLRIKSIKSRFISNILPDFSTVSGYSNLTFNSNTIYLGNIYDSQARAYIGLEIIFTINNPTKNYNNEIIVYKVYPSKNIYNGGRISSENMNLNLENREMTSYPNPFDNQSSIIYHIDQSCHVKLKVFTIDGKEVGTLIDNDQVAGYHTVKWNGLSNLGAQLPNGVYIYRLYAGNKVEAKKVLLQK